MSSRKRLLLHVYFCTNEHGERLVYFKPECDVGREWLTRQAPRCADIRTGIWLSCKPAIDDTRAGICHASLFATFACLTGGFRLIAHPDKGPVAKGDAPGWRFDDAHGLSTWPRDKRE